jgi:hypothetical protein
MREIREGVNRPKGIRPTILIERYDGARRASPRPEMLIDYPGSTDMGLTSGRRRTIRAMLREGRSQR